jgi:hypothetical protein
MEDDFTSIDETELELVMDRLNHRPRKCLDFMSALEKFFYLSIAPQSRILHIYDMKATIVVFRASAQDQYGTTSHYSIFLDHFPTRFD